MTDKDKTNENGESTIFSSENQVAVKPKKKSSSKKQLRAILVLLGAVIAAVCLYFFVVAPIVNYVEEAAKTEIELLDGEVLGTNDRILIFEHCERKDIGEIAVHNEFGDYSFYYDTEDREFFVKGHEYAPYSKELFSSLVVDTGYTLSIDRVTTDCEDMSEYGLEESKDLPYFTVTTRPDKGGNTKSHTVYIGNLTPSGAGYYARYEGRNAVYILNVSLAGTVLAPIENLITPILALPMNANDYYMLKDFMVADREDVLIAITYLTPDEKEKAAMNSAYKMLYPANYTVNSTNYAEILKMLQNFQGTRTVALSPTDEEIEIYGLSDPAFSLSYTYQGIEQTVMFSEKNENGNYYAASLLFNIIAEVDGESMAWLEWHLIDWVDPPIFMMNINNIKTITVKGTDSVRTFDLEGEGQELVITERDTGFKPEVQNFREFYKTLLSFHLQGYATDDLSPEQLAALTHDEPSLTLIIETRGGVINEYKFYPYSTRRAYYTVNESGEFYVLRDEAAKILSDAEKVMTNTPIEQ